MRFSKVKNAHCILHRRTSIPKQTRIQNPRCQIQDSQDGIPNAGNKTLTQTPDVRFGTLASKPRIRTLTLAPRLWLQVLGPSAEKALDPEPLRKFIIDFIKMVNQTPEGNKPLTPLLILFSTK